MADNISFEEVTSISGIDYRGESYGGSWGDFNGDNYPDLYVNNHAEPEVLYLNQGDGTFADISSQVFSEELRELRRDAHGVAWADFDNDGDQDLIQLVGGGSGVGTGPNQMYVNEGGKLEDRASELGIDYPLSRGRTPLWLDFDKDGWLDLFQGNISRPDGQAPPTIFRQTNNGFEDVRETTEFDISSSAFGILSDLSGDGNLDLFLRGDSPRTIYDMTSIPFEDITASLTSSGGIAWSPDIVSGDFNGDLRSDLYLTRNKLQNPSDLVQDDSDTVKAKIVSQGDQKGVQFDSLGNLTFEIDDNVSVNNIYVGASGFNPNDLNFTLSSDNPDVEGILPHTPGVDRGIYIGYDSNQQQWQVLVSSPDQENFDLSALINSSEAISDLTAIGFNPDTRPPEDQLLLNTDEGLVDQSQESGINSIPTIGNSVVSGDLDNDMDLDLYIVATGNAGNRPNILYENQGDGTFIAVPDAGGAEGTNLGVGDSVVTADYDLDGFLDLFVTNGNEPPTFTQNAPYQLFRNQGNSNNWLEIDLEGVVSNRDGIGAQVFVTAGGVTQLREQSGGIHKTAQNHQRLHFGLADNTQVDEILIKWTNGQEQRINDVSANQLLHIIEPSDSFAPGKSARQDDSESGVFLWKDTFDGPYKLRTVGSEELSEFSVNLIATDGVQDVTPFSLEAGDELKETEFGFSLNSQISSEQDGVEFDLAPGSQALISITQDGVANPRQLHVGSEGNPLSPDGWILDSEDFPLRPNFTPGEDLGLFVGQGSSSENLEFRWNGDGNFPQTNLSVLSSEEADFSPVGLESSEQLTNFSNKIAIEGGVSTGVEGVDVTTGESAKIGFAYEQDSLVQPHRVNPNLQDEMLQSPNAYWLPLATPYGQPEYDPSEDSGVFLWKSDRDLWRLRVVAGTESNRRYVGSIISDTPATFAEGIKTESNDLVNTNDPLKIDFDLKVSQGFQDGIDFSFSEGASLTLNLESPGEETAALLQVGAERWSVSELPLDLSNW
ncbi:hypothetical protein H1P_280034 [Hyella patelloides LEGE 07179]|uniref:ASPIC/UnbV domain-containing protein n=1 Tax=Hyella patelloides LEGE 07179 TaxID=945734 RepID=A0A563VTF1_9CYAN|nr:CRTAC1 family protein [Hyella patelloides]VEP14693.1 hypothetical protein H1P_280034 [Hyella patelloides LEGE 07179]